VLAQISNEAKYANTAFNGTLYASPNTPFVDWFGSGVINGTASGAVAPAVSPVVTLLTIALAAAAALMA
jgi:hypothetical protein